VDPELYDLASDPTESANRAVEEHERVEALRGRLRDLIAESAPAPKGAAVEVDAATREQLRSLGYALGSPSQIEDELATLEVTGVDPTELMSDVGAVARALASVEASDGPGAAKAFEALAERYPRSTEVIQGLLDAYLLLGRADDAISILRRGIEVDPEYVRFWSNLAELLIGTGDDDEAEEVLRAARVRWPCHEILQGHLAQLHARNGRVRERLAVLEEAVAICDAPPATLNDLAYALATVSDAELRDGARALSLARKASDALGGENPLALDTLAVAHAESGHPEEAKRTLRRALALARQQRLDESVLRVLGAHLAELEAGRPVRE
jgi:tetratricopeptide (TPR) repeat protein